MVARTLSKDCCTGPLAHEALVHGVQVTNVPHGTGEVSQFQCCLNITYCPVNMLVHSTCMCTYQPGYTNLSNQYQPHRLIRRRMDSNHISAHQYETNCPKCLKQETKHLHVTSILKSCWTLSSSQLRGKAMHSATHCHHKRCCTTCKLTAHSTQHRGTAQSHPQRWPATVSASPDPISTSYPQDCGERSC